MTITELYKKVIAIYRRDLPKCHVNPKSRKWLLEAYPSLDRGTAWNRTLYDMNVHSWDAPYSTGICLSLSLFISEVLSEQDIEIFGLYDRGQFNHSIIKYQDKFYDAFHPQGVRDKRLTHANGKQYVASAEQSFLQLEKEGYPYEAGCAYLALTPCFRDESILDMTHYNIFLKLEIFNYDPDFVKSDLYWAKTMVEFFISEGLVTNVVKTSEGYDVITDDELELGSFGYRVSPKGIPYVYATGLAEPRASLAISRNKFSPGE